MPLIGKVHFYWSIRWMEPSHHNNNFKTFIHRYFKLYKKPTKKKHSLMINSLR